MNRPRKVLRRSTDFRARTVYLTFPFGSKYDSNDWTGISWEGLKSKSFQVDGSRWGNSFDQNERFPGPVGRAVLFVTAVTIIVTAVSIVAVPRLQPSQYRRGLYARVGAETNTSLLKIIIIVVRRDARQIVCRSCAWITTIHAVYNIRITGMRRAYKHEKSHTPESQSSSVCMYLYLICSVRAYKYNNIIQ